MTEVTKIRSTGFIDVHIHGAMGIDVNEADADGLVTIAEYLATQGVVAWLPTLVPDSDENYRRVIDQIERVMEIQAGLPIAQAVGVHYEGVFANEKMCGALRPQYFKQFTGGELAELPRLRSGVHMMTYAPESPGGLELTKELVKQGWVASIGHTNADTATLDAAFNAGARHLTHFYNAMTGLHHRDVGVVGWALANREATFDIIADGIHVNPQMAALACRVKGTDKVTLISDAVAPTGLGDGEFHLWGETVTVRGGRTENERGSIAGSVISMLDAVKTMLRSGFAADDVLAMASENPARLLKIEERLKAFGSVVIDESGELHEVVINGRQVEI